MFTLDNIQQAHARFTGPDFSKLIAAFRAMTMVKNQVDIQQGQVIYWAKDGQKLVTSGLKVTAVSSSSDSQKFAQILAIHQDGQSDFPSFCQQAADVGVAKWQIDLEGLTCSYYDLADGLVLAEPISLVSEN